MPYTICLVEPVLPFKSCSLKTIVFIFLVPFSSGLSWKIILIHRWSTLWWNFVFLSCEFGADRSFLAPCWDLLTNPLAPERSVTSGWFFRGSCWYLLPSHGAQLDKQWWGLRVHTLTAPTKPMWPGVADRILHYLFPTKTWQSPVLTKRTGNGLTISNSHWRHLGRNCQTRPLL